MKQAELSAYFKTAAAVSDVRNHPRPSQPNQVQARPTGARDHSVYESKRLRLFQPSWLNTFPWLRYDKDNDAMYCECCREFKHLHPNSKINLIKGDSAFRKHSLTSHETSLGHQKCIGAFKGKKTE